MGTDSGPMTGPDPELTITEAAAVAGVTEKTIRNWIKAGHLAAIVHPEGRRIGRGDLLAYLRTRAGHAVEHLPPEARPDPVPVTGTDLRTESGPTPETGPEPIEARFRVTPAEIERAVERTGARYLADMETILTRVGKVYEGQLAAKDETIATQAEMLAELRRRAEVAEAELEGARLRLAEATPPAVVVVAGQETTEAAHATATTPTAPTPARGLWWRLRRVWRGG